MPLINFEVSLVLTWSENCVITSKTTRNGSPGVIAGNNLTNANLK